MAQQNSYYCGPAALQSVLAYYGIEKFQQTIGREAGTTADSGTPVSKMQRLLDSYGIKSKLVENLSDWQLRQKLDAKHPMILMIQAWSGRPDTDWVNTWHSGHYVIAIGYDQKRVYFMDPYVVGSYAWLTWSDLDDRWHDHGLEGIVVRAAIEVMPKKVYTPLPDLVEMQ